MVLLATVKAATPESIKNLLRPIRNRFLRKYAAELSFWKRECESQQGRFKNSYYRRVMLAMAEETTDDFLRGKIVADFGCGPCGTLAWAGSALLRIGIDVLADRYAETFPDDIMSHGMIYVTSTEQVIPLPAALIDVMFTLNAMDHVDRFATMCSEIVRVLKPGGELIGSFNLEEPATPCEPQQLNERIIRAKLLSQLEVQSYRITAPGPAGNRYAPFLDGSLSYTPGKMGLLWVRARKPG
jgi:SAM-dependent methyltransferase